MESTKALTMESKVNYNCTPVIYYQSYIGLSMGPSMVNVRVLLMGSYRSTYGSAGSAKRFTVIFNPYTPWLCGIIFSGTLWSPYLSLFLSYIWSREECFIPRREIRSISSRGPIDTLSIYCLRERLFHFQTSIGFLKIFEP